MFKFIRDWKRRRLARKPFPGEWEEHLAEIEFVDDIPDDEIEAFRTHLKVFAWEKTWIAAGDLEGVTDEMKVTIAAAAARMSRRLGLHTWDRLSEVVVYPRSYRHPEDHAEVLGEAHHWGVVVLSWGDVDRGVRVDNDGHDTAVHEFAHVLDVEDGWFDGTPILDDGDDYHTWAQVMSKHFERLKEDPITGMLRDYGATNEAEFFAVATEAFFEKPKKLRRKAPDLYDALKSFYDIDPAEQ